LATTTHYEHTPRQMTGVRRTQRGGVSSAKTLLRRGADDWLFAMRDGSLVITLIDQFDKVLELAGITHNSHGDKYTLYSLRHFYAVLSLRRGIGVFDVARNMGTSVQVIQNYYSKHATPRKLATQLGD
jgi:integrase